MPASFNAHDGLVDINFSWLNIEVDRATEIIGFAAHYLWLKARGPRVIVEVDGVEEEIQKPWVDLSNQEKLTIVFQYSTKAIIDMARTAKIDAGVGDARELAEQYAKDEFILD